MALFTWSVAPVIILCLSDSAQSSAHDKPNSISQFISSKSRNLQKLLRHLSGIVTSAFKAGTGSRGCGFPS